MTRDETGQGSCVPVTPVSCADCALGEHANRTAQFCPFIIRRYPAGTELFSSRRPMADHIWMVMDGVVGLFFEGQPHRVAELRLPGAIVSSMAAGGQVVSARVLSPATLCGAPRADYERWVNEVRGSAEGSLDVDVEVDVDVDVEVDIEMDEDPVVKEVRWRNITCPESAHLEMIAYSAGPDGMIARVEACTAFEPHSAVACNELCATRLNQRRRVELTQIGVAPPKRSDDRGEPDSG